MLGRVRKNPYRGLEKKLGHSFKRRKLLGMSLVHRSFRFENDGIDNDNQRLEFLGDAVLGLVAGAWIYRKFLKGDEGTMTQLRSRITRNTSQYGWTQD